MVIGDLNVIVYKILSYLSFSLGQNWSMLKLTTDKTSKEMAVNWVNDIFKKEGKLKKVQQCLIMTNGRIYKMLTRK